MALPGEDMSVRRVAQTEVRTHSHFPTLERIRHPAQRVNSLQRHGNVNMLRDVGSVI